ncbi:hypothetical protein GCM10011313_10710 [Mycetocola zhadangensis]|nr:hypothetical protein GCM10011313_10710 [Mycetocola zhadangensis]
MTLAAATSLRPTPWAAETGIVDVSVVSLMTLLGCERALCEVCDQCNRPIMEITLIHKVLPGRCLALGRVEAGKQEGL